MTTLTAAQAAERTKAIGPEVQEKINQLTSTVFRTRGGRLGSGMGLLLEGLWGYYTTELLTPDGLEMAWLADHQYNDFACVDTTREWEPETRGGELFRVEAKSMNLGADESKGHFDEIVQNILPDDLLVVLVWRWESDESRVWPKVQEIFIDRALPIAQFRDTMHLARGGSFVDRNACPDGCIPANCSHHGEPLNAKRTRERPQGPNATRGAKASHAANFGSLVRMLKARGQKARDIQEAALKTNPVARSYWEFVERNVGQPEEVD